MIKASISREILAKIPLFSRLSSGERQQIADISTVETFTAGEVILEEGKTSQILWIVIEGHCEVVTHLPSERNEIVLADIEPYHSFGEMSFFHSAPHSANVRAKTDLKLMRIEREDFDTLLASSSWGAYKLALNTVETLAERLRRMDTWVTELLDQSTSNKSEPEWRQFRDKLFSEWNNV